MTRVAPNFFLTAIAILFAAITANAGTLQGTIVNRTTGQPAANVEVTILNPMQNMRELGTVKSDTRGQFTLTNDQIGLGPLLARATFQDVAFNTSLPPGRPTAEVDVYEVTKDPKSINLVSHVVILQPNGDKLTGGEEYVVNNVSQPPKAYFKTEGNFEFAIPEQAELRQVSSVGSTGMSINQAPIDKGKGRNAIAYAFRPGETSIRLAYELPYPGNLATLTLPAVYPGVKMLVVAPPGVHLKADGLKATGREQGMQLYSHDPLPAKAGLTVSVSGVGSPEAADSNDAQGQGTPQKGNSRTGNAEVQAVPGRLDSLKWPLLIGFGLMFALGAFTLSRKKIVVAPAGEEDEREATPVTKTASYQSAPAAPSATLAASLAAVNQHVNSSMDALKDALFRIELRRQAGTISEEDYARERAVLEQKIRDLLRG